LFATVTEKLTIKVESFQQEKQLKTNQNIIEDNKRREEYDLSKMKSRPNPYAKHLKREITIDTDISVIEYFKEMAQKNGLSYQNLINLYLKDCVNSNHKLKMQ
jgi:uncharacterized protein (DUF4415 family)